MNSRERREERRFTTSIECKLFFIVLEIKFEIFGEGFFTLNPCVRVELGMVYYKV